MNYENIIDDFKGHHIAIHNHSVHYLTHQPIKNSIESELKIGFAIGLRVYF